MIMTKKLFEFMNKNKIKYAVMRGDNPKSERLGKDLDILILKEDYKKFKNKFPRTERVVDFYIDEEKKKGVIIVPREALNRRVFDKKKGFFVLSDEDIKRMNFFRKIVWTVRKIKKILGMYKDKGKNKGKYNLRYSKVLSRNFRMFGLRYVFWDIFYQIFRLIHSKTQKKRIQEQKEKKKKQLIKKKINDYEMFIYKNGQGIHRDLLLKGTREEVSVGIIKNFLKPGDIVLEAGANIGYYAILESKLVGDKGIVYAVEPIKENFQLLKKNITLNRLKNVKTFNLGFSDYSGKIKINVSSEGNLNTPKDIQGRENFRIESVGCETLDSFFKNKKKPDFMRIDIEGYEDVVFNGGDKTLDSLKVIFVELHFPLIEKQKMINLLQKLKQKGFEIHKAVMEWERLEDETTWLGRFVNYLYKKKSRPIVYNSDELSIDKLIKSKDFLEGHLSLEVFFVKRNKKKNEK